MSNCSLVDAHRVARCSQSWASSNLCLVWVIRSRELNYHGTNKFLIRPPLPAQLMYPNLVVVSWSIFLYDLKKTTQGLFHVWLGLYANLLVAFFSFVFVSFGMWAYLGFGGLAIFFLFLIISFSRFQYFNLHFGSLKLCFTNLVLEIRDNLSLIFLSSLDISNLIYFTHFRLFPIIKGHISKFKPRFVQYAKI